MSMFKFYIATFATSSIIITSMLQSLEWVEIKGVGCILELNAYLDFS